MAWRWWPAGGGQEEREGDRQTVTNFKKLICTNCRSESCINLNESVVSVVYSLLVSVALFKSQPFYAQMEQIEDFRSIQDGLRN